MGTLSTECPQNNIQNKSYFNYYHSHILRYSPGVMPSTRLNTLFIGEQIGFLEKQGKADSYVFGFEESYGYLSGSYVRDKDAVDAS